ncbi:MAG: glycosyltransferase family 39 protein [Candidatus Micrarchaeota archaeon]
MGLKGMHLLTLILTIQFLAHYSLLSAPFQVDEGFYLTSAWLFTKGNIVIKDFFDVHPPGFSIFGGILFSLFGSSEQTARLAMAILQVLTTAMLFTLGKSVSDERTALIVSFVYALTEISFGGFRFLADGALVFLATSSVLALHFFLRKNNPQYLIAAGIFTGMMLCVRQSAVFHLLFLIGLLLFTRKRHTNLFISFSLLPPLIIAIFYIINGGFDRLIEYVFFTPSALSMSFLGRLKPHMVLYAVLFVPLVISFRDFRKFITERNTRRTTDTLLIIVWALSGMTAFFPVPIFLHVLQALPAIILLTYTSPQVRFVSPIWKHSSSLFRYLSTALFSTIMLFSLYTAYNGGMIFQEEQVTGMEEFRTYVHASTKENDTMLAYPHFPVYFFSGRVPASHYMVLLYYFPEDARERVLSDIENNRPALFIKADNISFAPDIESYITSHYKHEKTFDYSWFHNISVYRLIE